MLSYLDNPGSAKSCVWSRLFPIVIITAIPLGLFRLHIIGATTFIGNSDRLNSFLNILRFHTRGLREGGLLAWNDGMFMGINTFALPYTFPNPLVLVESAVPPGNLYYVAGIVSCLLLSTAGLAAYTAMRTLGTSSYAAFIGAVLYQCSALSILKVSQNDMSFAVLIVIPLMMKEIRTALDDSPVKGFVRLCVILSCLLWFMFLQKAAYALLLGGGYALSLAWHKKTWRPFTVFTGGLAVAICGAVPRIHALWRELQFVDRNTPGIDLRSFDQLYEFQNIRWFEVFRWFDNGIFGRFPAEAAALGNNINLTEGMLLYTSVFAAFVVLMASVRYRSRWFAIPLCRAGDASFCFYAFSIVVCVIVVKPIGALLYHLFLHWDFTHARIIVAGLFPLCALISFAVDDLGSLHEGTPEWANFKKLGMLTVAGACAVTILLNMVPMYKVSTVPPSTDHSFTDFNRVSDVFTGRYFEMVFPDRERSGPTRIVQMPVASVTRIVIASICISGVFFWLQRSRSRTPAHGWSPLVLGAAMLCDAVVGADFQLNGPHVRSNGIPFVSGNLFQGRGDEFSPPSTEALAAFKRRLEIDEYRSVTVCQPRLFPAGCAAHLSAFWGLRLVDGYSIGVPRVLSALSWPAGIRYLRDVTFTSAQDLPWNVLSLLNVKYAVVVNEALYKNRVDAGMNAREAAASDVEILENPLPITPRAFVARRAEPVSSASEGVAKLLDSRSRLDPEQTSFVEGLERAMDFHPQGEPHASFHGDRVEIDLVSSAEPQFLVLNERPHPGWRAYSNGSELSVYPTNVAMRGILVPAGVNHVSLRFDAFGLARLWILFPLGSIVLVLLGALLLSRTTKQYGKCLAVSRQE